MFDRAILHLDLDAFFVAVECLHNDALRGKPVIIGGSSDRGVVASCSYEARRFGVHSAMPMKMALHLCPDAMVMKGDMEEYSRQSAIITDIIEEEAPLFEKASIDEFYLDLTGMDRYFGSWKWSKQLKDKINRESGLPLSIGLSVNKLVSKVGVGVHKPNAEKVVELGTEKGFLAPLPVRVLPTIGKETYKRLAFMGVRTIHTLAEIPPMLLQREFGKHGLAMWKKANAIDDSPVIPYNERKSISTERTFQTDTIDVHWLRDRLTDMLSQLTFELRKAGKLTSCVTIKLRYTDFNTYTRQRKIAYTANDKTLLRHVHELFEQVYQRRQLVRLVGIKFSGLVVGNHQIDLFDDTEKEVSLLQTMDRIRQRFGDKILRKASTMGNAKKK
ncbi:MAG: DNA polymerase IV [Saprospiraceae bacterium]|nr:MAG: DNA polymerase IV [Saprospiraceae bacterium]